MSMRKLSTLFIQGTLVGFVFCISGTGVFAQEVSLSNEKIVTLLGEAENARAGLSVSPAGDVNGDGYDDFLVGTATEGAYLVYGQEDLWNNTTLNSSTSAHFSNENDSDALGASVSTAGDVNGDGYDDFLIGATGNDEGGSNAGAVYLVYGQAQDLTDRTIRSSNSTKFLGEAAADAAGSAVSTAGDVNGDGYDDIIIGVKNNAGSAASSGAVYLIYGQAEELDDTTLSNTTTSKFNGERSNDFAGLAVSTAGDLNGDGYDDIIIGSMQDSGGAVYLLYGQASALSDRTLSSSNSVKFTSNDAINDILGSDVSKAGDVNGDGYDDILLGDQKNSDSLPGDVYLLYGQANTFSDMAINSSTAVQFASEASDDDGIGSAVAAAGDVNGDGYDDFIIGAYLHDTIAANAGSTYVVYGQEDELTNSTFGSTTAVEFTGEEEGDNAGYSVSVAGDVNGDGLADVIVGASSKESTDTGAVYLAYMYIDEDRDGLPGNQGIFNGTDTNDNDFDNDGSETGTDCDDTDTTVDSEQTYYEDADGDGLGNARFKTSLCSSIPPDGYADNDTDTDDSIKNNGIELDDDGVDNDGDSKIDELNTLKENGVHPEYGMYDASDSSLYKRAVDEIKKTTNGDILVRYADNSVYLYDVFPVQTKRATRVASYSNTGYLFVLHPKGRKIKLLNVYTGASLSKKKLAPRNFRRNNLYITQVRKKSVAIISSKKRERVRISLVTVRMSREELKKKRSIHLFDRRVRVKRTHLNGYDIHLRSRYNKRLYTYRVKKYFGLREIKP